MSMNEAHTRYHLIDPALRDKGYVGRGQIVARAIDRLGVLLKAEAMVRQRP